RAPAVSISPAHVGSLPAALTDLTSVITNAQGQVGGPFMASIPAGPAGWGSYDYTPVPSAGTFTISNSLASASHNALESLQAVDRESASRLSPKTLTPPQIAS